VFILETLAFHVVRYPEDVLSSVHITFLCMCCVEKRYVVLGNKRNTCMSIVGKRRNLSLKIKASIDRTESRKSRNRHLSRNHLHVTVIAQGRVFYVKCLQ